MTAMTSTTTGCPTWCQTDHDEQRQQYDDLQRKALPDEVADLLPYTPIHRHTIGSVTVAIPSGSYTIAVRLDGDEVDGTGVWVDFPHQMADLDADQSRELARLLVLAADRLDEDVMQVHNVSQPEPVEHRPDRFAHGYCACGNLLHD